MTDSDCLGEIESTFGFSYPPSFRELHPMLIALSQKKGFSEFMPKTRMVASIPELMKAYDNGLPGYLIPFFLEEHTKHIDYFVFDTCTLGPEYRVGIFAIHALVHDWTDFPSFLKWLETRVSR